MVNLRTANTHERFHSLLDTLIATQNILEPVLRQVTDTELDPAIPSFVFHCSAWSDCFGGPFDIMHDASKPIARARELLVSLMAPEESSATVGYDRRTMVFPLKSTGIHFYDSNMKHLESGQYPRLEATRLRRVVQVLQQAAARRQVSAQLTTRFARVVKAVGQPRTSTVKR